MRKRNIGVAVAIAGVALTGAACSSQPTVITLPPSNIKRTQPTVPPPPVFTLTTFTKSQLKAAHAVVVKLIKHTGPINLGIIKGKEPWLGVDVSCESSSPKALLLVGTYMGASCYDYNNQNIWHPHVQGTNIKLNIKTQSNVTWILYIVESQREISFPVTTGVPTGNSGTGPATGNSGTGSPAGG